MMHTAYVQITTVYKGKLQ